MHMASPHYFRRTLRAAHLRLIPSRARSPEENLRVMLAAARRVGLALRDDPPPAAIVVFEAEAVSGVVDVPDPDGGVLSLPRRDRDPALVLQEINGCKSLLLEIIRRAAYDWVLYRSSRRLLQHKLAEQAFTWLFKETDSHPDARERNDSGKQITSFEAICSALDLDPDAVRTHVRRLTPKNVMSVGRPAEYRRRESAPHAPEEASVVLGGRVLAAEWADVDDSYEE